MIKVVIKLEKEEVSIKFNELYGATVALNNATEQINAGAKVVMIKNDDKDTDTVVVKSDLIHGIIIDKGDD